jgi:heme exporter protein D
MDGASGFLGMGGYAFYVWTSYGLSAAVLIALLGASVRELRRARQELERVQRAASAPRGEGT